MTSSYNIRYLDRSEIEIAKWDRCVDRSPNGWLYARSFYLDCLGSWGALVAGDYEYMMPLPKKKKWGLQYAYVPPLIGQLGIIGPRQATTDLTNAFIRHIPRRFSLVDILLSEQTPTPTLPGIRTTRRINFILPLNEKYTNLHKNYSEDAKKNLRRSARHGLRPVFDELPMTSVIRLYKAAYGEKNSHLTASDYAKIACLGENCIAKGLGFTVGIVDGQHQLQAGAFLGKDDKRIYYLLGAPTGTGRRNSAIHCLIDEVIQRYADTDLTFDFEGSDIPSVAAFYRKFSPQETWLDQVYFHLISRWRNSF